MELRFSGHARDALEEHSITREAVEEAILNAFATFEQQDAVRYHAMVEGRGIGVVVKKHTFPVLVITTFPLREEWLP